ncbi:MAG: hypothetical protein F6K35_40435 [Okeania sp. SIO2H7]|nr:hypothetical protein [Okeania sp. SIO2H7]
MPRTSTPAEDPCQQFLPKRNRTFHTSPPQQATAKKQEVRQNSCDRPSYSETPETATPNLAEVD